MNNLKNQLQSDVNQKMPRRKNALSYKECSIMEQEAKKNNQDNVENKLKVSSFSQLNLNNKIVKK